MEFEEAQPVCAAIYISKADFSATFDEQQGVWVATWKWSAGQAPEKFQNRISVYLVSSELRENYMSELKTWMDSGWLLLYSDEVFDPSKELLKHVQRNCKNGNSRG